MQNQYKESSILEPIVAVKQNFSLQKALKIVLQKGKKVFVTHFRPPPPPPPLECHVLFE
jgi:hypothetical protein